jgi:peptide-methionine (R)-S-oxide reductase
MRRASALLFRMATARLGKSEAEWQAQLTAAEFHVLRNKGTEPRGTGEYDGFYPAKGHFVCRGCRAPLFLAAAKFSSGCGWPAFERCVAGAVAAHADHSGGRRRIEITCARCDGHLGHVFHGERLTAADERHCVNSLSIRYVDEPPPPEAATEEVLKDKLLRGGLLAPSSF